jgi:isopentenyl phosphate kinase
MTAPALVPAPAPDGTRRPVVVKVGGSVLTDKRGVRRLDARNVALLGQAIAEHWPGLAPGLILLLGSGSFGHRLFHDLGLYGGDLIGDRDLAAELSGHFNGYAQMIVAELRGAGLPAEHIPLPGAAGTAPLTVAELAAQAALMAAAGLLPVLTGGLVATGDGYLAVSSDRVAGWVAAACGSPYVIMITNVPGVLRDVADPGSVITELAARDIGHLAEQMGRAAAAADVVDRTGGMAGKLSSLAEAAAHGVHGIVTGWDTGPACPGPGRVFAALRAGGELPGTHVPPAGTAPDQPTTRSASA